jgi:excisionase family DNA binding protein
MQAPTPLEEARGLSHAREGEIWLTAREAAELTGVSTVTVYSWVRIGHLKVERLDHRGQKLFRDLDVARAEMATRAKAKRRPETTSRFRRPG